MFLVHCFSETSFLSPGSLTSLILALESVTMRFYGILYRGEEEIARG